MKASSKTNSNHLTSLLGRVTIGYVMRPEELKSMRKRLGITQEELASSLGVHRVSVARWEAGMRKIPNMLTLAIKALESERQKGRK